MTERPLKIVSVNMNRRTTMNALLQDNDADILLVQEPWFFNITPRTSDSDPSGVAVLGPLLNNLWHCFLPLHDPSSDTCLVAIYIKSSLCSLPTDVFSAIGRHSHPWSSLSCMVLDINVHGEPLRLVNVYHQVAKDGSGPGPGFRAILNSPDPQPHLPSLIAGDFNTHSRLWSLPSVRASRWAQSVETWIIDQDYQLISEPDAPTWQSHSNPNHRSIIDLIFLNTPAASSDQFSTVTSSFVDSFGSDHAALSTSWTPIAAIPAYVPTLLPGFKLDDEQREAWSKIFGSTQPPVITDAPSTDAAAASLIQHILDSCTPLFPRRTTADPRGARWWNADCATALTVYRAARSQSRRKVTITNLRSTIRKAKRNWAQNYLDSADPMSFWKATRWRHGRRASRLPLLRFPNEPEPASTDPAVQAGILRTRFFASVPTPVDVHQPDDPAPLPVRDFEPITDDEVRRALSDTSNSSAPGLSGVNYKLLKWALATSPGRFVDLFNGCVRFGTHPWHSAKVVPVPKPHKPDYGVAKAYRPISLLECCGKLLEKIIASRVMFDASLHPILPPQQFGSREDHCTIDAALAVVHTAQSCRRTKLVCSLLLFDVQGFFDNINVERLIYLFALFGFPPELCAWLRSFLVDRQVHIQVNEFLSEPFSLSHGIPQGSPLSPILSAIYTAPLLFSCQSTLGRSVYMYVDDGAIVTSGVTRRHAATLAAQGFKHVTGWLARNGLRIDPDKTEFIAFDDPKWAVRTHGAPFTHLDLRTPDMEFSVPLSPFVRYLGIFIDRKLSWSQHTEFISNRVRSTVTTLGVLGNSIRGISFANWRRVFHAIIIPILTYGAPLWYTGINQKSITQRLQVAQNTAIRKMCGVFHTTPTTPLHHVVNILPITLTLARLSDSFKLRIQRLPPNTVIRTILHSNPAASWGIERPIPTTLRSLLPPHPPPYVRQSPPYRRFWSHPRVLDHLSTDNNTPVGTSIALLAKSPAPSSLSLFVYPLPHPDFPSAGFLLYCGDVIVARGARGGRRLVEVLFQSLTDGLRACLTQTPKPVTIFLPFQLARAPIFHLRKHAMLPLSVTFTSQLSELLADHDHHIRLYRFAATRPKASNRPRRRPFSSQWLGPNGKDTHLQQLLEGLQDPNLPPPTPTPKDAAFNKWRDSYSPTGSSPAWLACQPTEGPSFLPPFIRGILSVASRRYLCTCLQLLFRHAFCAEYSEQFRPTAEDTTECPCGTTTVLPHITIHHSLTVAHGLLRCPDGDTARPSLLRHTRISPLPLIFSSEEGGKALCEYIHATQMFLRPLPPRPDPP